MPVQPIVHQSRPGGASRGSLDDVWPVVRPLDSFGVDLAMSNPTGEWSTARGWTAPSRYHRGDPRTFHPYHPPARYVPDYQGLVERSDHPQTTVVHARGWQAGSAPPLYHNPRPSFPQMVIPPVYHLHEMLGYARRGAASTARAMQSNRVGWHICQPATTPSTPWLMVAINYGDTPTRIPVHASPENPTTVTVNDVLSAIDLALLDLETPWAGNDPYNEAGAGNGGHRAEEMCLCLRPETPIDYFREVYGKAGLVRSEEGPYTWEWKVRRPR